MGGVAMMHSAGFKCREPRRQVHLRASIRLGGRESEVLILNWSSRGMMLSAPCPPERGEYVEVRTGDQSWVARVVWSNGCRMGVRTRDNVTLGTVGRQLATLLHAGKSTASIQPRNKAIGLPAAYLSRLMQWAAITIAGMSAAVGVAATAQTVLSDAFDPVSSALQRGRR
ncbi:PilZ domain-containing protein [Novosphingobium marinum]|uniref:PilZ domain-containing protein n=1 Tax=Novosphingobium marinum TaxID=1514948 RepID=UPI003570F742